MRWQRWAELEVDVENWGCDLGRIEDRACHTWRWVVGDINGTREGGKARSRRGRLYAIGGVSLEPLGQVSSYGVLPMASNVPSTLRSGF